MSCAQSTAHIELENTGNHDRGLQPIAVLKHGKPERLGTIDEDPAPNPRLSRTTQFPHGYSGRSEREDLELVESSACLGVCPLTMLE